MRTGPSVRCSCADKLWFYRDAVSAWAAGAIATGKRDASKLIPFDAS